LSADDLLFPLWQVDRDEYAVVCRYLGLTPSEPLYKRLSDHLAQLTFTATCPRGFALHLARLRLTRFRIAPLDLVTRLFIPAHPVRHVLNAVIALHECDGRGFRELSASPDGFAVWPTLLATAAGLAARAAWTLPWLCWQAAAHASALLTGRRTELDGRKVLVTGVGRGLGRDLLLHCLERGAAVVGTVRNSETGAELTSRLPAAAPLRLVVADLEKPNALPAALRSAGIEAASIDIAIACAGVKHAGTTALSLPELRRTFEVNLFAAAELANWLCAGLGSHAPGSQRPRSLVLVSSMGRWHGMHGSAGYNASKAALSIWGESVEMDLQHAAPGRLTLTIVEPGLFASDMTRPAGLRRWMLAPRRRVAEAIVDGAAAGRRTIRPPFWFALVTWGVCLAGRAFRSRLFGRVGSGAD
jgi:NAD(P)-dependent dehydrogenase (short-subunit alcohol dehydrogenase family)